MRYLVLIMIAAALFLAGCQRDEAEAPADVNGEAVELEDDLTEVYDDAMAQAEQAEAEIAELLERGPEESRESAVQRVWERAQVLAADARDEARRAWQIARDNGDDAVAEARDAAERARERADMAWEEASAFTGDTWAQAREAALELRAQADEAWSRLHDEVPEAPEEDAED
jgi:hypothetical protein